MRFALIGPAHPLRGGIAQHTGSLARALEREHDVLVVSFSRQYPRLLFPGATQQAPPAAASAPEGPPAQPWLDSLDPRSWRRAAAGIAEFRPDALLMQWWHPFFAPAYASLASRLRRRSAAPLLVLCHNVFPHERFPRPLRWLERRLIRSVLGKADGLLVQAESLGRQAALFNPAAPQRQVAHPIYDFFTQWDPGPAKAGPGPAQLLFFGNVRRYKGLEVFLEALHLLEGRLDFCATVAGEFYVPSRPLHEMARRWGLDGRIRWESRYLPDAEVPALFRRADLVVLPYLEATQSGVVPLAYQFDVPVVSTRVGGLAEMVQDGLTGYLCPPGDAAALADAVERFFREGRADEFRRHIRRVRARLSWPQVIDSILDLLKELSQPH